MARVKCLPGRLGIAKTRVSSPVVKLTDPHYGTQAHKRWAAQVIQRAGGRCQWPGCGKAQPKHRMFADHIVERQDGGAELDLANGQALCSRHHSLKTAAERVKRMTIRY